MLTLVGWVEWRRRVGRCPNRCAGSHRAPFDAVLGIVPYQQTSIELVRLGCLLAVFLPFELAVQLLSQLCGICLSDDTVWHWVQQFGRQAMQQLDHELVNLQQGVEHIAALQSRLQLEALRQGIRLMDVLIPCSQTTP
jgi:hypothetical protein